ncbi:MAG: hypothetical protein IT338_17645 [Thermomicrobiales bacterium]|nr:hypothetical protein [Thermomicrobiales bacterium]
MSNQPADAFTTDLLGRRVAILRRTGDWDRGFTFTPDGEGIVRGVAMIHAHLVVTVELLEGLTEYTSGDLGQLPPVRGDLVTIDTYSSNGRGPEPGVRIRVLPDPPTPADEPSKMVTPAPAPPASRNPCVRAEFDPSGNVVAILTYVGGRGFQPITVDRRGDPLVQRADIADLVEQLQAQMERSR